MPPITDIDGRDRRRLWPGDVSLALGTVLLLTLAACSATIRAPPAVEPRAVYLLDHGRHTSLLLTDSDDHLWRYAYGEWRWYVDAERGAGRALGALFRPTPAGVGRARLTGPANLDVLQPQVGALLRNILRFEAEAERVDLLLDRLDTLFEAQHESRVYSPQLMLEMVVDPRPYSLGHNSNHRVADWLEELGIDVRGNPLVGRWKPVADPD